MTALAQYYLCKGFTGRGDFPGVHYRRDIAARASGGAGVRVVRPGHGAIAAIAVVRGGDDGVCAFSYHIVQVRISKPHVLPYLSRMAVPGLFIGCLLAISLVVSACTHRFGSPTW